MTARELRQKYIKFFTARGHKEIPSASLVPENDPSTLFISAGMHPLVPFLLGEPHPSGKRLVDIQKCLRTEDIDLVGNTYYHTFFEMLGNWSLGDYFKEEMIPWSYEFLTKELEIDPKRLNVTVFEGDKDAPRDEETARLWEKVGIPKERIFFLGKEDNWWGPVGKTGPCGPDSEMYFDTGKDSCGSDCKPGCHCGKYLEFWNDVFMEYQKLQDGSFVPLKQKNVDTGMGVDRTTAILEGSCDNFTTELFVPIIRTVENLSGKRYVDSEATSSMRIIADHLRAACFVIADGVLPSNKDRGYILRRLLRRAIRFGRKLGIENDFCDEIAQAVIATYQDDWPELRKKESTIVEEIIREEERFSQTLSRGLREFEKLAAKKSSLGEISGAEAFDLYQSYGFPLELTIELAVEKGLKVDGEGFNQIAKDHQEKSREGLEKKFAGGLVDHSEIVTKYHTATHLLQAALRRVLGDHVRQEGSNLNAERLRFDFSHDQALTPAQIEEVERLVNAAIAKNLPVTVETMSLDEAKKSQALAFFGEKYGDSVKIYTIADLASSEIYSKEVCGGPHVEGTGVLGRFKIIKEESVGRGVRRIKAVLT